MRQGGNLWIEFTDKFVKKKNDIWDQNNELESSQILRIQNITNEKK